MVDAILKIGEDIPADVASHLMWNDKLLIAVNVDAATIEGPPISASPGPGGDANLGRTASYQPPPGAGQARTYCTVEINDLKFLKAFTLETLWRNRTSLWPGPGTYPYLLAQVESQASRFRDYASYSEVEGQALFEL